jgi:hypothetical protein
MLVRRRARSMPWIALASCVLGSAMVGQTADPSVYRIISDRMVDSGRLGELAIDPATRTLYGAGSKVIDIDHDSIIGAMSPALGHGFAFADALGRGITRRGAIFDLHTRAVLGEGRQYSGASVAYDARTRRAAINFDSLNIIDVASGQPLAAIPIGGPQYVVSDGHGHFIADLASDTLAVVDASRLVVTKRWSLSPCQNPAGMAVDQRGQRVFVSCGNHQLLVVNYMTGGVVAVLPMRWSASQLAFDAATRLLFVPTEHDTLTVVKQQARDSYSILTNVAVTSMRSAIAIDPVTHRVYLLHFGQGAQPAGAISVTVLSVADR